MAQVFRPTFHVDPVTGKRVNSGFPGAVCKKSPTWWIRYYAPDGKRHKVMGYRDRKATESKAAELEKRAQRVDAGFSDATDAHAKTPLTEHLADYLRDLKAKGRVAEHVAKTEARINVVLKGCGFTLIRDLDPQKVALFIQTLRQDKPRPELPHEQYWFTPAEMIAALGGRRPAQLARFLRREGLAVEGNGKKRRYPRPTVEALQDCYCRGIGISTSNGYAVTVRAFSRWLAKRVGRDMLAALENLNADTDQRHERRPLDLGQLRAVLLATFQSQTTFQGLSGADRFALYTLAMTTGYRASELASLFRYSFDLAGQPPVVRVKAAYAKNKMDSEQPLPSDVAENMRAYLAGRPADCLVWPGRWHKDAAEMLRRDLTAAGIPYRDEAGRVADFHALRASFITLLSRSGATPKEAQELARHSDIRLTMQVYTHIGLGDLASAVDGLPSVLPPKGSPDSNAGVLKATGTDGRSGRLAMCHEAASSQMDSADSLGPSLGPRRGKMGDEAGQSGTTTALETDDEEAEKPSVLCVFPAISGVEEETTRPGFEPGQREPKSLVLPLHYRVKVISK